MDLFNISAAKEMHDILKDMQDEFRPPATAKKNIFTVSFT